MNDPLQASIGGLVVINQVHIQVHVVKCTSELCCCCMTLSCFQQTFIIVYI